MRSGHGYRDPLPSVSELQQVGELHATPARHALGFEFEIAASKPAIAQYLSELYRSLSPARRPADHRYTLVVDEGPSELSFDGVRLLQGTVTDVFDHLVWHLNRQVIEQGSEHLLLHAAAAEGEGHAVLIPAPSGSGKTTLVAGLVQAGLRYVTDEAVALDSTTGRVLPYPKPLSVKPGSWHALAGLRPAPPSDLAGVMKRQWHVGPHSIPGGHVSDGGDVRIIVFPCYQPGAATVLEPLHRAEAMVTLTQNCFNLAGHGADGVDLLAGMVRRSDPYRLVMGDLDEGCRLVKSLLQ